MKYTFEIDEIHKIKGIKVNLLLEHCGYRFNVWLLGFGNIGGGYSKKEALQTAKDYILSHNLTSEIVKEKQSIYKKVPK